jgi:hypothetical protein
MNAKSAKKPKLSRIAKQMVEEYEIVTRGGSEWLTDKVRRALLADAMATVMLAQHGVAEQSGQDSLVEAYLEARNHLGL